MIRIGRVTPVATFLGAVPVLVTKDRRLPGHDLEKLAQIPVVPSRRVIRRPSHPSGLAVEVATADGEANTNVATLVLFVGTMSPGNTG